MCSAVLQEENADRILQEGDYLLSEEEEKLLNAVCTSYEKVIVVINTGGLVDLSFMEQHENIYGLMIQLGAAGDGKADPAAFVMILSAAR